MTYRKTFSLTQGDMQKLDPIMKRHNGNFSAALRELISLGEIMISRFGSVENALHEMHPKKSLSQELVEKRYGVILPYSLVQWGLRLLRGFLPPPGSLTTPVHDDIAHSKGVPSAITENTYKEWENLLNELYPQLGWEVRMTLECHDSMLVVGFNGLDPEISHLAQMVLSARLAFQDPPYKVEELREYLPLVTIYYRKCDSKEEASERLEHVFHFQKELHEALQKRRALLSRMISLLGDFNYEVTILPSEYMEELLSGHFSLFLLKMIQRQVAKSVSELTPGELLDALEDANEVIHLYKKMETKDHGLIFFHSYDDPASVQKLGTILNEIFHQVNLSFTVETAENMLIFKRLPVEPAKPKVLIVEESLDSLLSLKYELEHDYEVIDAQDGLEAVKRAQERPDVILLNASLPKLNGVNVCAQLKKEKEMKDIPVILIISSPRSTEELSSFGAEDYVVKPFELGDLKVRIDAILAKGSKKG